MCLCDIGTLTTVQVVLSGIRFPHGVVDTVFEDFVAESLHKVLTFVSVFVCLLVTVLSVTF